MIIETHPLQPFFPTHATVLMLGSFPPPKSRWKMDFYYPNLQNDMWRIFGLVFFNDRNHFLTDDAKGFKQEKIETFLKEKGIALYDTAVKVQRLKDNASDKFLDIVEKIDLGSVLNLLPDCQTIIATGEKAAETLLSVISLEIAVPSPGNSVHVMYQNRQLEIWRMPSSSRAYPRPLVDKALVYSRMFRTSGLL